VSRGEFATVGFRNRDLRRLLHPTTDAASPADVRRLAAKEVSRQLRLLRAHGVVQKFSKTHRYKLSPKATS
jgi:DNA-binding IclR family transcriptional regulator